MNTCRSCGAAVRFARTAKGKTQILDAEPAENGNVQLVSVGGEELAQVVGPMDIAAAQIAGTPLYLDHHATCPQAQEWRERAQSQ